VRPTLSSNNEALSRIAALAKPASANIGIITFSMAENALSK
jgi:hypothetical protein